MSSSSSSNVDLDELTAKDNELEFVDDEFTDDEEEYTDLVYTCPFGLEVDTSTKTRKEKAKEIWNNVEKKLGFNFEKTCKELNLDFYNRIRLFNYLRINGLKISDKCLKNNLNFELTDNQLKEFINNDYFLIPALQNDGLLMDINESYDDNNDSNDINININNGNANEAIKELENIVAKTHLNDKNDTTNDKKLSKNDKTISNNSDILISEKDNNDGYYFESYAESEIHRTMLNDKVRTNAYRDFIYENKNLFTNKTVLDVGCGTGILSMFAARAGASKVFAVDNSDIIFKAQANILENNLDDKIKCIRGKIEDISLPVESVDIIISEWMGYALLFEAMLDSILVARDKFLLGYNSINSKDTDNVGLMVPSETKLFLTAVSDDSFIDDNLNYWSNVYGFKMSAMMPPKSDVIIHYFSESSEIVSSPSCFKSISISSASLNEITSFKSPFSIIISKDNVTLDAFVIYFDTFFDDNRKNHDKNIIPVHFTTGPQGEKTHWFSAAFIPHPTLFQLPLSKGDVISGEITYQQMKNNNRNLVISITATVKDKTASKVYTLK